MSLLRHLIANLRWRKAMSNFDRQIKAAQKSHSPVAHIYHARQQFTHDCLRKAVGL